MEPSRNIIIGAGLSGLACASRLHDCLVLEKEETIGGLCRTVHFNGLRFDLGGHRFFTSNREIERAIRDLLAGHSHEVDRHSKIYWDRGYIDYPLKKSVIFKMTPWQAGFCLFSYFYRKVRPLEERSFYEKATNRFGDELYRLFLKNYTQKVWGLPCSDISGELVDIRLQNVSLLRAIQYAFRKDSRTRSFADRFLYPDKGICRIPEFLARDVSVKLRTEVTGLAVEGKRIVKVFADNGGEFRCRHLVSTMPLTRLVPLLDPPPPVREAVRRLHYRSIIFVFLVLNKKSYSENHWIYFPGAEVFGRLHEPKNWSTTMAPADRTGICLEIFCDRADGLWTMTDAEIAHQVIRDLPLVDRFDVMDHAVIREEYAYPVYKKGYRDDLRSVQEYLSGYENLHLLGRTGSFQYVNMDVCLEEGFRLGSHLNAPSPWPREVACHP